MFILLQKPPGPLLQEVLKILPDLPQHRIPVHGHHSLRVNNSNFIKICLNVLNTLPGNWVDVFKSLEILEDNGHIKVLNAKWDSFKVHSLNVFQVNHKERKLTDGNQTVFSWSDLYHWLLGTTLETKFINGNVKLDLVGSLLRLVLNQLCEVKKLLG